MYLSNLKVKIFNKSIKLLIVFIFIITTNILYAQVNPFQPGTPAARNTSHQPPNSQQKQLKDKIEFESKMIDISAITGTTFKTSQFVLNLGVQAYVFITPLLGIGAQISRELIYSYDSIYNFDGVIRVFFKKQGSIIPFFHVETGYALGQKLNGFSCRPGFGFINYVYGIFSIHLAVLFDFWYFTYRFNKDDESLPYYENKLDKTNFDVRIIFGLTFIIKG